nr:MAG TPA: hypothetical protein [Caudoviricetes sp.]
MHKKRRYYLDIILSAGRGRRIVFLCKSDFLGVFPSALEVNICKKLEGEERS